MASPIKKKINPKLFIWRTEAFVKKGLRSGMYQNWGWGCIKLSSTFDSKFMNVQE